MNQAISKDIDDDYAELAMMNHDDHIYNTTEFEEIFMADYDFNPRENYDLKDFFGLLTQHEEIGRFKLKDYRNDFMGGEFSDYETLKQLTDAEAASFESQNDTIYYRTEEILVTAYSGFYQAYHIGTTINDCIFIGSCTDHEELDNYNNINRMIDMYLETGLYGFTYK